MIALWSLAVLAGFFLLIKGAEFLVDGASSMAKLFAISEIAIGLTIVAFGTSAPELIVNVISSIQGHDEIAFGNIIGSNIFNILVVLGIAGLVKPISVQRNTVRKEIPFLLAGTIIVFFLANSMTSTYNGLTRFDGVLLIIGLLIFFFYVSRMSKSNVLDGIDIEVFTMKKSIMFIAFGVIGLFAGGEMVVHFSVLIAKSVGVSDKFIGLTIIALGTSLPELVTSVIAVKKNHFDLAIGNVIGSNLFNLFLVLGLSSIIHPIGFNLDLNVDFMFLIFITLVFFFTMYTGKKHKLDRFEAGIFVFLYIAYTVFIFIRR